MEITIERRFKKPEHTIGKMLIDGVKFCDTLEDTVREFDVDGTGKVQGKTAIPEGRYRVILTMSNRFKRNLPEILNVPYFTAIRIHAGNTVKDTEGCPLVGINDKAGWLSKSRVYESKLTAKIAIAITSGEKVYITIK